MSATTLYGIANCDTVRKARRWLDEHGIEFCFHDVRKDGLSGEKVAQWLAAVGHERLVNRRSATWRQLPAAKRAGIDNTSAVALLLAQPTLIKRPVLEHGNTIHVGFSAQDYTNIF